MRTNSFVEKIFYTRCTEIFLSFCDLCWSVPQCYRLTRDRVADSLSVQPIHLIYQNKALYVDCGLFNSIGCKGVC